MKKKVQPETKNVQKPNGIQFSFKQKKKKILIIEFLLIIWEDSSKFKRFKKLNTNNTFKFTSPCPHSQKGRAVSLVTETKIYCNDLHVTKGRRKTRQRKTSKDSG